MQKLVFRNANGIELDLTTDPFGITEWEGFSADELNIQSQQVPFQDGGVFLDALLGERELSVTVAMNDGNNLEKRYRLKREMISKLNPKLGEGVLIYTNDYLSKQIHCIPQLPVFENHNSNDSGTPKASCVFTACNPYWEDLEDTVVEFDTSENPVIENQGDVPAQLEIEFKTSEVTNPLLVRVNGNKKIQYNGTLNDDLFINTKQGEKEVTTSTTTLALSLSNVAIDGICYSKTLDLYIAITGNTILKSNDCENWETVFVADSNLYKIAYAEDMPLFVIIEGNTKTLTSSDGINWQETTIPAFSGLTNADLKYFESLGKFYYLTSANTLFSSTDGINWTSAITGGTVASAVAYSPELHTFIVADYGKVMKSTDGTTWVAISLTGVNSVSDVLWVSGLGLFIATGGTGKVFISADGTNWNEVDTGTNANIGKLRYSVRLEKIIAIGTYTNTIVALTSSDGEEWESEEYSTTENFVSCIECLDYLGYIILGGINYTIFSSDGITWDFPSLSLGSIDNVVFIEEKGFYLGFGKSRYGTTNGIVKSTDGKTWEYIDLLKGVSLTGHGILYSQSLASIYIFLGRTIDNDYVYECYTSQDGNNWESETINISGMDNVVWAENKNIFCTSTGYGSAISSDGITWQESENQFTMGSKIVYNEEAQKFICRAYDGIYTSADGLEWAKTLNVSGDVTTDIVSWGKGFAVSTNADKIYKSKNGTDWFEVNAPTILHLFYSPYEKLVYGINYDSEQIGNTFIYKTQNLAIWQTSEMFMTNYVQQIAFSNSLKQAIYIGNSIFYTDRKNGINVIQNLSKNSDINLNLALGENLFRLNQSAGSFTCTIKYRQKYVGV